MFVLEEATILHADCDAFFASVRSGTIRRFAACPSRSDPGS